MRVLDFSMFLAGPYAGRLLADHGAEVIKIEPPGGETIRSAHPVVDGNSRYFAQLNAGKKCITLDLKSEEGKAAVQKLIVDSDVVLENFRPGVLDRLGLGYEFLNEIIRSHLLCDFRLRPGWPEFEPAGLCADCPCACRLRYDGFQYANVSDRLIN